MISKETLAKIHELLATEMQGRLERGSVVRNADGELVEASITAAEMNVIRQFLKDNGVDKASDPEGASESPFAELVRRTNDGLAALQSNKKAN